MKRLVLAVVTADLLLVVLRCQAQPQSSGPPPQPIPTHIIFVDGIPHAIPNTVPPLPPGAFLVWNEEKLEWLTNSRAPEMVTQTKLPPYDPYFRPPVPPPAKVVLLNRLLNFQVYITCTNCGWSGAKVPTGGTSNPAGEMLLHFGCTNGHSVVVEYKVATAPPPQQWELTFNWVGETNCDFRLYERCAHDGPWQFAGASSTGTDTNGAVVLNLGYLDHPCRFFTVGFSNWNSNAESFVGPDVKLKIQRDP